MSIGKVYSYALTAATAKSFPGGRYLRLLTADAAVDIEFFDESGQPLGTMVGVLGGFSIHVEDFGEKFGRRVSTFGLVKITSATNQTVDVVISRVRVDYDRLTGSVSATLASSTVTTQSRVTVGSASAALLAADANRNRAQIRNLSLTDGFYMADDSTTVTTANGFYVGPEETVEYMGVDGLNAIREGAVDVAVAILIEKD